MAENKTFTTITDAEQYVREALQEWEGHYDVPTIAREVTEWQDGKLAIAMSDTDFWRVVEEHEKD